MVELLSNHMYHSRVHPRPPLGRPYRLEHFPNIQAQHSNHRQGPFYLSLLRSPLFPQLPLWSL